MNKCHYCQSETNNPKFCSRSCSASSSNKIIKRRKLTNQCCMCETKIGSKLKYCENCFKTRRIAIDITLQDAIYHQHHRSNTYTLIRGRARTIAKRLGWKCCSKCGYDKHIEIAHVKPIGSYPPETKLSVINDESNLLALCPNCHWEFDNSK